MNEYQYFVIFCISTILTAHYSSGTGRQGSPKKPDGIGYDSSPHGKEKHSNQRHSDHELNYQTEEVLPFSQDQNNYEFSIYDSSYDMSSIRIFEALIDHPKKEQEKSPLFSKRIDDSSNPPLYHELQPRSRNDISESSSSQIEPLFPKDSHNTYNSQKRKKSFSLDLDSILEDLINNGYWETFQKNHENIPHKVGEFSDNIISQHIQNSVQQSLKEPHESLYVENIPHKVGEFSDNIISQHIQNSVQQSLKEPHESLYVENIPHKVEEFGDNIISQQIPNSVEQSLKEPHESPNRELTDQNMVELVAGSGVMINSKTLASLSTQFQSNSRRLVRKLFPEIIPLEELKISTISFNPGFKKIPKNIRKTVQAFVNKIAVPKLSNHEFTKVLCFYLNHIRASSNNKKKLNQECTIKTLGQNSRQHRESVSPVSSPDSALQSNGDSSPMQAKKTTVKLHQKLGEFLTFPVSESEMVELVPGSKIMINAKKLRLIVSMYENSPVHLIRLLFEELIPLKELATMSITSRGGKKSVPENIRNAVEEFVKRESKEPIDHEKFLYTLRYQLANLKKLNGNKKRVPNE